jgi:uncharacterized Zn finger protein
MSRNSGHDNDWRSYIPVAERRRLAAKKIAKLKRAGRMISPVEIAGRKITTTFWGNAWSQNLESYSDYANRLPRGRTYVRNGSLVDLQIEGGRVQALVSGSEIYEVDIEIKRLAKARWIKVKDQCAGQIASLVEMLQGSISKGVMEIVTRKGTGLFPAPREISFDCTCPDWATMFKHVASALYGVGIRLDHRPELLFTLRGVDPVEMVDAAIDRPMPASRSRSGGRLESGELSSVFGVDIVNVADAGPNTAASRKKADSGSRRKVRKNSTARKTQAKRSGKKSARKKSAKKKSAKKGSAKKKFDVKKSAGKKGRARKAALKKSRTRKASRKKSSA